MALARISLYTTPPYNPGFTGIAASSTLVSEWIPTANFIQMIAVIADANAPGELYLDFSNDEVTIYNTSSVSYSSVEQIIAPVTAPFCRIRIITGSLTTTSGIATLNGIVATFKNMGNADATTLTGAITDKGGQVYNVKAYGAKIDGSTDDTSAWNSAFSAASTAGGGIVYHPGGTSVITSTLVIPSGVWVMGVGGFLGYAPGDTPIGSIIKPSGTGPIDTIATPSTASKGIRISGIAVDGAFSATGYAVHVYDVSGLVIDNFSYISGVANGPGGIFLDGISSGGYGCSLSNVSLEVGLGYLGGTGLKVGGAAPFNANHFSNITIQGFAQGLDFNYGGGNTGEMIWVQFCTNGILFGSSKCVVYGGWMESITTDWINFASPGDEYSLVDSMRFAAVPTIVGHLGKITNSNNYNPTGPQTAPTIPASGTALTNPFPFDCTVYVSGGTVTAIAVGGTATGLTSGAIFIPAGETITLTYSAAPTWVWIGN